MPRSCPAQYTRQAIIKSPHVRTLRVGELHLEDAADAADLAAGQVP